MTPENHQLPDALKRPGQLRSDFLATERRLKEAQEQKEISELEQQLKGMAPVWNKAFAIRTKVQNLQKALKKAKTAAHASEVNRLEEDLQAQMKLYKSTDEILEGLVRTEMMLFRNTLTAADITKTGSGYKDAPELIGGVLKQLRVLRNDKDLGVYLAEQLANVVDLADLAIIFQRKKLLAGELASFFENGFASPRKLYKKASENIPDTILALKEAFFKKKKVDGLQQEVATKIRALELVLNSPFVQALEQTTAQPYDPVAVKTAIIDFRWQCNRELKAMVTEIQRTEAKVFERLSFNDSEKNFNLTDNDTLEVICEKLWNGSFRSAPNPFMDSLLATTNLITKRRLIDIINRKGHNYESLDGEAILNLHWDKDAHRNIPATEFMQTYRQPLTSWLAELEQVTQRPRGGLGVKAFMEHSYAISPVMEDSSSEATFIQQQSDLLDITYGTYQGRVSNGERQGDKSF